MGYTLPGGEFESGYYLCLWDVTPNKLTVAGVTPKLLLKVMPVGRVTGGGAKQTNQPIYLPLIGVFAKNGHRVA